MEQKSTLYIVVVDGEGSNKSLSVPFPVSNLTEDSFEGLYEVLEPIFGISNLRYAYYQNVTTGERIPIAS